ncbi:MAG: ABC transporter substrate-binding protein [Acidimicrobiia bacterium]
MLALAACSSSSDSGSSPGAGNRAGGQGPVERLTIALPEDFGPLNIFASSEESLNELVYDKLMTPSPYVDEPRPWLAEEVTAVDPSTWDVRVRDDVTWHDGEPFTADDVAFTFEFFKRAPSGTFTHHIAEVPHVSTIDRLAPDTLRLRCAYPCPELRDITLAFVPILPEHVWAEVAEPAQFAELPVGTGPYEMVSYDATRGYRFRANDGYFAGRPLVDELVMPVIEDPSATFTALRTGEIDTAARGVPPELLESFSRRDDIEVTTTAPLQFLELRLNYQRPPFEVPAFRRALSLAVDRRQLLDVVLLGQGRPATRGYPHPDSPWTNPELSTPYDPAEASASLDGLGWDDADSDGIREGPDGKPLAFTLKVNGAEPTHIRAAELVVEDLAEVGVAADLVTLDAGAVADLFRSRDFDIAVNVIGAHGVADPTQFIMSHRSGYLWDAPEIPYPGWDALFERWKATTDLRSRTEVLFEMQEFFNQAPTSIPLVYPDENWAFRPEAYDGWVESPGHGIIHKWSLLPPDVGRGVNAIAQGSAQRS